VFAIGVGAFQLYYGNPNPDSANNVSQQSTSPAYEPLTPAENLDSKPNTDGAVATLNEPLQSDNNAHVADAPAKHPISSGQKPQGSRTDNITSSDLETSVPANNFNEKIFPKGPSDFSGSVVLGEKRKDLRDLPSTIDDKNLPAFYSARNIKLTVYPEVAEGDPVAAMLARLEAREKEVSGVREEKKNENNKTENLWTSIGFAAGSFNTIHPSASSPATTLMASSAQIADPEAKASGYSYSMGVNVGTRVSERWVLQGGVNYLSHSSDYTANNAVVAPDFQSFKPASTNELVNVAQKELDEKIVYTAPYNVNNSLRYLSIPLTAGYMIINKSFGLQLNAGVATDLFLQNTVKADGDKIGGKVDNTTQSSGAQSPYRSVNLSGLVGTELSYRFGAHYRVALNPGIRYPFNTIYKSDLGLQANPLTVDIGLRFRYIFH
jgi:hypothetical protein